MKKALLAVAALAALAQFPAHAISPAYRAQLERSGCTDASVAVGCNVEKSREWNERHGYQTAPEYGYNERQNPREHHRRRESQRREIEQFLNDSVIGEDVLDARQALYNYGCERLGPDHWMKDDHEIRLTSMGGRVRSGRVH